MVVCVVPAPGDTDGSMSRVGAADAGATRARSSAIATTHAPSVARPRRRRPGTNSCRVRAGTAGEGVDRSILFARMGPLRGAGNGTGVRCDPADLPHVPAVPWAVRWTAGWRMVPPAEAVTPVRSLSPWECAREDGGHGCHLPVPPADARNARPDDERHRAWRPVDRRRPRPRLRRLRD